MALTMKKVLLLLLEVWLGEVGLFFEKEYPWWQLLARTVTWPPTLVVVVEIPLTEGVREETEVLAELKQKRLIEFAACSPTIEKMPREAEPSVVVWREKATEPYQILYEMHPSGHFVLVFPLERTDVVERIQLAGDGWRDPGETTRNRFIVPANPIRPYGWRKYEKCVQSLSPRSHLWPFWVISSAFQVWIGFDWKGVDTVPCTLTAFVGYAPGTPRPSHDTPPEASWRKQLC
jgi:hypothetical protein